MDGLCNLFFFLLPALNCRDESLYFVENSSICIQSTFFSFILIFAHLAMGKKIKSSIEECVHFQYRILYIILVGTHWRQDTKWDQQDWIHSDSFSYKCTRFVYTGGGKFISSCSVCCFYSMHNLEEMYVMSRTLAATENEKLFFGLLHVL